MKAPATTSPHPSPQARDALAERLRRRRGEIEQAALTRIYAISDPHGVADPTYAEGLRTALSAALDYGLDAIERGEERPPPIPPVLLIQARLAARNGVSLDAVLRRYFAGYTLLCDVLIEEAQGGGELGGAELKHLLHTQAALFDRLVGAVAEEYGRESEHRLASREERRVKHVKRLLDGELLDTSSLAYEIDAWHVGVVAVGRGVERTLRGLAEALDRTLLMLRPGEEAVWAWLGGRRPIPTAGLVEKIADDGLGCVIAALGEPAHGIDGWRLTYRQAAAALRVAQHGSDALVRYTDVGLLASVLQDEVLVASLHQLYLAPLDDAADGGVALLETLRAFLAADRNVSSTAAALGVSRRTVSHRIQTIEDTLSRSLNGPTAELETALRLSELDTHLWQTARTN
jgi:hypothetical protein